MTVTRYTGSGYNLYTKLDIYTVPAGKIAKVKLNPCKLKDNYGISNYSNLYTSIVYSSSNIFHAVDTGNILFDSEAEFKVGNYSLISNGAINMTISLHCLDDKVLAVNVLNGAVGDFYIKDYIAYKNGVSVTNLDNNYILIKEHKNGFILTEGETVSLTVHNSLYQNTDYKYDFVVFEEDI